MTQTPSKVYVRAAFKAFLKRNGFSSVSKANSWKQPFGALFVARLSTLNPLRIRDKPCEVNLCVLGDTHSTHGPESGRILCMELMVLHTVNIFRQAASPNPYRRDAADKTL